MSVVSPLSLDRETLASAVLVAMKRQSPNSSRFAGDARSSMGVSPAMFQQATAYCEQVKASIDGYRLCLEMLTDTRQQQKLPEEVVFFALQVVESAVVQHPSGLYDSLSLQERHTLRQSLFSWIQTCLAAPAPVWPLFLRNKIASLVVHLLRRQYAQEYPQYLPELLSLLLPSSLSNVADAKNTLSLDDFYLRVCKAIDQEIVCRLIHRSQADADLNLVLKDKMRSEAIPQMMSAWNRILDKYFATDTRLASSCLEIIAAYTSWIDVGLVVTESFIGKLYQLLGSQPPLRIAILHCLKEIIAKGMPVQDKLQLLQTLNLHAIFQGLPLGSDVDFDCALGQLLAAVGHELLESYDSIPATATVDPGNVNTATSLMHVKQMARNLLQQHFLPLILPFFSVDYGKDVDPIGASAGSLALEVVPFITEFLNLLRREHKKDPKLPADPMTVEFIQQTQPFRLQLLQLIVGKMRFHPSFLYPSADSLHTSGAGGEKMSIISTPMSMSLGSLRSLNDPTDDQSQEDEEELSFHSRRRQMKILFDAISALDETAVTEYVWTTAQQMIPQHRNMEFTDLELVLFLIFNFGEAIRSVQFVQTAKGNHGGAGGGQELTVLGKLVVLLLNHSDITQLQEKPIVPLMYLETIVHYAQFFTTSNLPTNVVHFSTVIPAVLAPMLDHRGAHHPVSTIQQRLWYLLLRFAKVLVSMKREALPDYDGMVLSAVQCLADLLVIRPDTRPVTNMELTPRQESLMTLLEAVGVLMAAMRQESKRAECLKVVLEPLNQEIREVMMKELYKQPDYIYVSLLRQAMLAIGSISKGFEKSDPVVVPALQQSMEILLSVLQVIGKWEPIREAARVAFQRMIPVMGPQILPYLPSLTTGLTTDCSLKELCDYLSFLSSLMFKNKRKLYDQLNDTVLPLIQKIFQYLSTEVSPAEAEVDPERKVQWKDLRVRYLSFLNALFQNELDRVLLSEKNAPHILNVLQTIVPCAMDSSDVSSQKLAFSVLLRILNYWYGDGKSLESTGTSKKATPVAVAPAQVPLPVVPESVMHFLFENVTRICLELPLLPEFLVDRLGVQKTSVDEGSDAAYHVVVGEIATIQKTASVRFGDMYTQFLLTQNVWRYVLADALERWPLRSCTTEQRSSFVETLKQHGVFGKSPVHVDLLAKEYVQALHGLEMKVFRVHFKGLVKQLRVEISNLV